MHVLITRPEPDASEMREALAREGHTADVAPLLEIALEPPPADVFEGIAGLVVTSRNGLRAIAASPALPKLLHLPLFVVGSGTAKTARELGFTDVMLGPAAAKDLLPVILEGFPRLAMAKGLAGDLLHVSGDKLSFDLAPPLQEHGITLRRRIVYRSVPASGLAPEVLAQLKRRAYDAVVLMSPVTAQTYLHHVGVNGLTEAARHPAYLCLSGGIAQSLTPLGAVRVRVAAKPNIEEAVALVRHLAEELERRSPVPPG